MYYTSTNKSELEAYNDLVTNNEGYDGHYTTKWANIIEHPTREEYAILANSKYEEETLNLEPTLSNDWFVDVEL